MTQSRFFTFTCNNYTPEQEQFYKDLAEKEDAIVIFGYEIGEQGTRHLQGYVEFRHLKRYATFAKRSHSHWEKAKADFWANFKYCTKSGSFWFSEWEYDRCDVDLAPYQDKNGLWLKEYASCVLFGYDVPFALDLANNYEKFWTPILYTGKNFHLIDSIE